MSVYIKGMEMPTDCRDCPLVDTLKDCPCFSMPDEEFWNPKSPLRFERHKDCPLIPVPDHGDLIDRDASLYKLGRIVLPDDLAYTIGHDMAKRFFEKAPTIIPADKEEGK